MRFGEEAIVRPLQAADGRPSTPGGPGRRRAGRAHRPKCRRAWRDEVLPFLVGRAVRPIPGLVELHAMQRIETSLDLVDEAAKTRSDGVEVIENTAILAAAMEAS